MAHINQKKLKALRGQAVKAKGTQTNFQGQEARNNRDRPEQFGKITTKKNEEGRVTEVFETGEFTEEDAARKVASDQALAAGEPKTSLADLSKGRAAIDLSKSQEFTITNPVSQRDLSVKYGALTGSAEERELLDPGSTSKRRTVNIGGKKIHLPDAFRKSVREGTFTNITDPFERAIAQANLDAGIDTGVENVGLDISQVPQSGDLDVLARKFNVGQGTIVSARREQNRGVVTNEVGSVGSRETQAFNLRSGLPQDVLVGTNNTFFDESSGVEVFAPTGSHFELFEGGGVKLVEGPLPEGSTGAPASSLFTQGFTGSPDDKTPVEGFTQDQLALTPAEGKEISRIGNSTFNSETGADFTVGEDEVLIEYTDGTFEVRKRTDPNKPGETKPTSQAGKSVDELREEQGLPPLEETTKTVEQILETGGTAEEAEAAIKEAGLTPTSDLEFLGLTFQSKEQGKVIKADKGMAFFRAPDGTVLQRRQELIPLATGATGRERTEPVTSEKTTQALTDAVGNETTVEYDTSNLGSQPVKTATEMYNDTLDALGMRDIKSQIDYINGELKALDDKFADDEAALNGDPWLGTNVRNRKLKELVSKYERKRELQTNRLAIFSALETAAREDAKFIVNTTIQQSQFKEQMDFSKLQLAYEREDEAFNRKIQQANLELNQAQLDQNAAQFQDNFDENQRQFNVSTEQAQQRIDISKRRGGGTGKTKVVASSQGINALAARVANGTLDLKRVPVSQRGDVATLAVAYATYLANDDIQTMASQGTNKQDALRQVVEAYPEIDKQTLQAAVDQIYIDFPNQSDQTSLWADVKSFIAGLF